VWWLWLSFSALICGISGKQSLLPFNQLLLKNKINRQHQKTKADEVVAAQWFVFEN
jgi:hypothetical protein